MRNTRTSQRVRASAAVPPGVGEDAGYQSELPEHLYSSESEAQQEGGTEQEVQTSLDLLDSAENRPTSEPGGGSVNSARPPTHYRNPAFGLVGTPEVKVAKTPAQPLSAPFPKVRFSEVKVTHTPRSLSGRKQAVGKSGDKQQPVVGQSGKKGKKSRETAPPPPPPDSSSSSSESSSSSALSSGSEADSELEVGQGAVLPLPHDKHNPFPRRARHSLVPKLFTPVQSKEFEQIVENSYYQQFEAEVLITVLSYLHDWQAWSADVAVKARKGNQELFTHIDRSFAHVSAISDVVEDRYAELVLRATCKGDLGKGTVEAWSVTRRGVANGLYLPDRCQKVLKKIHEKQVSSLVSKAGKASSKEASATGSSK